MNTYRKVDIISFKSFITLPCLPYTGYRMIKDPQYSKHDDIASS